MTFAMHAFSYTPPRLFYFPNPGDSKQAMQKKYLNKVITKAAKFNDAVAVKNAVKRMGALEPPQEDWLLAGVKWTPWVSPTPCEPHPRAERTRIL